MKTLAKFIVASILAHFARAVLRKYKPVVVMVTGSVGKTSTKDAIQAALRKHYLVRASEKSYNSEFGVPLTIIGAKNPWTNAGKWIGVFEEALLLLIFPSNYPRLLVLEVGADSPGDLARILRIATPDVVVVTNLPEMPVHVEAYASPQAVRDEEFAPAYALCPGAPLIVSADDSYAVAMSAPLPVDLHTYGFDAGASVHLGKPKLAVESGHPSGMECTVTFDGEKYTLRAPGALGRQQLYAPAAALSVARALQVPIQTALEGLEGYVPPPGRSRILRGKNGSVLIDDSYNASPTAVIEALGALSLVPGKRRIAVIGDMLELGRYSVEEHQRVGDLACVSADVVVGIGSRARVIKEAALAAGCQPENAYSFDTSLEAAPVLADIVREGDVILVKGSQSIRTERVVEALLENPDDVSQLVRQDKEWKRR